MIDRHKSRKRVALAVATVAAVAAGALTSAALSSPSRLEGSAKGPAASTAGLNKRYVACLRANGATYTLIPKSGGMYRVDIPAAANAACAALDVAREAAADGDAKTADWLARINAPSAAFWSCVGAAGFHVTGGSGQRSDYGSAAFAAIARTCAADAGISLPSP
jgi:hypothetical protein